MLSATDPQLIMLPMSSPRLESESFFGIADKISYLFQIRGLSLSHRAVEAAHQKIVLHQLHPRHAPPPRIPAKVGLKSVETSFMLSPTSTIYKQRYSRCIVCASPRERPEMKFGMFADSGLAEFRECGCGDSRIWAFSTGRHMLQGVSPCSIREPVETFGSAARESGRTGERLA